MRGLEIKDVSLKSSQKELKELFASDQWADIIIVISSWLEDIRNLLEEAGVDECKKLQGIAAAIRKFMDLPSYIIMEQDANESGKGDENGTP